MFGGVDEQAITTLKELRRMRGKTIVTVADVDQLNRLLSN